VLNYPKDFAISNIRFQKKKINKQQKYTYKSNLRKILMIFDLIDHNEKSFFLIYLNKLIVHYISFHFLTVSLVIKYNSAYTCFYEVQKYVSNSAKYKLLTS